MLAQTGLSGLEFPSAPSGLLLEFCRSPLVLEARFLRLWCVILFLLWHRLEWVPSALYETKNVMRDQRQVKHNQEHQDECSISSNGPGTSGYSIS